MQARTDSLPNPDSALAKSKIPAKFQKTLVSVLRILLPQNSFARPSPFFLITDFENGPTTTISVVEEKLTSSSISRTVNRCGSEAQKHGLKLIYEDDKSAPYTVDGDKEKLRQVVLNFIDNAVKYTKTGTINVFVSRNNNKVVFAVKDSGMGISPEIMPTLSQKFARGEGGKLNTGGSGIGLYLAKEIVEAHHGRAWAESKGEGMGSQFYVELEAKV